MDLGFSLDRWWKEPAIIEKVHGTAISVVREDLLEGGSKLRFLPFLTRGAREIVFGGPFCGGAPLALSVLGRESGQRVTLFYARRSSLHPRQEAAAKNGARLVFVAPGYMTVVQKRARDYAALAGALFLPLGFDLPAASEPFVEAMRRVRARVGSPEEVWCATGSGMLARCLGVAFPESRVRAVVVGLRSRNAHQAFPPNVDLLDCAYRFEQPTAAGAPFPSCPNYDRKAWERCVVEARGSTLFWNVLG